MTIINTKSALVSVDAGAFLNIRPPANEEWIIHNIHHGTSAELYFTDGTNFIKMDTSAGEGSWLNFNFHTTNTIWIAVKNVGTASAFFGYDGVQSK